MKRRDRVMIGLSVAMFTVGLASAATYVWLGGGADDDWTTCLNWERTGQGLCYPSATDDDATIPTVVGTWDVGLDESGLTIGDLTIEGNVDFAPGTTASVDPVWIEVEKLKRRALPRVARFTCVCRPDIRKPLGSVRSSSFRMKLLPRTSFGTVAQVMW